MILPCRVGMILRVSVFRLDLYERFFNPVQVVKCPICNAKVPFSLQMHIHMVHGPGGKPTDDVPPYAGLPVPSAKQKGKGARKGRRHAGPRPGRRHRH